MKWHTSVSNNCSQGMLLIILISAKFYSNIRPHGFYQIGSELKLNEMISALTTLQFENNVTKTNTTKSGIYRESNLP